MVQWGRGGGDVQVEFDPFGRGSDTWGGEAGGGGLKGTPVVIWGWLSAQATLNPPKKNGPVPRRRKKADRQPFWFSQCMEKIMKSVFSL